MIVVDASVWVSRLISTDVRHTISHRWLGEYLAGGDIVVGPVTLLAEIAGAVARRTGEPTLGRRAVDDIVRLPGVRLVPIEPTLGTAAARIAADLGLRGMDAIYVAVAQALRIPLVTWDQEQRARGARLISARSPS